MTRRYCDVCGQEIARNFVAERLKGKVRCTTGENKHVSVSIEVTAGVAGTWNAGDLCIRCLLDCVVVVGGNEPRIDSERVRLNSYVLTGS